jgi:hypothetical protein
MSITNPFSMHRQAVWEERAADRSLPLWVRVAALAFGCHRRNGHANFIDHPLKVLLGEPGDHGEWKCVEESSISRAIAAAKKAGWIAEESNSRCLVVPHHAIEGGLGHEYDKCSVHMGKRTNKARPTNLVAVG